MLFSFLVTVREGFEIALILAIVLGYLARTGNRHHFREVWLGTGLAVAITVTVVLLLNLTDTELSGAAREAFEGFIMLGAAAMLTWMVLWMRWQAATLGRELRAQVDIALARGSTLALAGLAFSVVIREGIETALFLFAGASASTDSAGLFWSGGVLGFVVAAVLGYAVYRGSHLLPIRQFFTITGVMVLVIAAGLLSNGLAELHEAQLIASLGSRPWDTNAILPMSSTVGRLLHALVGYDPVPMWGQIVLFWTYLLGGLIALFGTGRGVRPSP